MLQIAYHDSLWECAEHLVELVTFIPGDGSLFKCTLSCADHINGEIYADNQAQNAIKTDNQDNGSGILCLHGACK